MQSSANSSLLDVYWQLITAPEQGQQLTLAGLAEVAEFGVPGLSFLEGLLDSL